MLIVGNVLVSDELIEKCFCCSLPQCKGECCVQGNVGAPISPEEVADLEENYPVYQQYMTDEGIAVIQQNHGNTFVFQDDGTFTTPLLPSSQACAFSFTENGITQCAIEKAFIFQKIVFRKPLSCFLYPIRMRRVGDYIALNYDHWDICASAREYGNQRHLPIYRFLEEPLTQLFGKEWFALLEKSVVHGKP